MCQNNLTPINKQVSLYMLENTTSYLGFLQGSKVKKKLSDWEMSQNFIFFILNMSCYTPSIFVCPQWCKKYMAGQRVHLLFLTAWCIRTSFISPASVYKCCCTLHLWTQLHASVHLCQHSLTGTSGGYVLDVYIYCVLCSHRNASVHHHCLGLWITNTECHLQQCL